MSRHRAGMSPLRPTEWTWASAPPQRRPAVVWWPASLPGSDLDERPRRKPAAPPRRRIRRGRILLVAA